MEVNSEAARLLLTGAMEDTLDTSDSDDCQSGDEEILKEREAKFREKNLKRKKAGKKEDEDEDYHKMTEVENRPYQTELLELAKKQNMIICLPTGSGKTFIALKLTDHMLSDAIEKKQKILFLANNVPLVNQQAKYFSQNLSSNITGDDKVVRAITGDLNVDIWKQEQWDEVFSVCHIIVASTQIILDCVTKGFIKWSQIALLILDECHHAQKNHPMAQLMTIYGERLRNGLSPLPRVLGLTATIIKGQSKPDLIPNDIQDIEELLCCKAVTTRNYEEVLKSSTSTILKIYPYETNFKTTDPVCQDVLQLVELLDSLPKNFGSKEEKSIIDKIKDPSLTSEEQIYNRDKGVPKTLKSFLNDLLKTHEELGPYCSRLAATLKVVYLVQWIRGLDEDIGGGDSNECGEIIESEPSILMLLELAKTKIFQFIRRLDIKMDGAAKEASLNTTGKKLTPEAFKIRHCVSNKVAILWNILMSKRPTGNAELDEANQLCGLIFCQRRITAQVMRWYLHEASKEWPGELGFLKPEVMIGHSTIVGDTELARFTAKRQSKIVYQFHKRELNLLVATQVVEEGLDVPACNLVIRLDSITSYPSFVQSLGRARKQGALCYALIDRKEEGKERDKINSYVRYNDRLSKALELSAIHVGEEDEDEPDIGRYAVPIPPFNPSGDPNGAMITAIEATSLVHRYCNGLSCDKIGALFPTAWKVDRFCEKEKRKIFKARVLLPIKSQVQEVVEGDWMTDKALAKRSAFLKCCERLYNEGELTENLLPKPRSIENYRCAFLDDLKKQREKEKETAVGKIGTKKRTQWYEKKTPMAFEQATPIQPGSPVFVYKINIELTRFVGDKSFKVLYDFDRNCQYYGIVTTADLQGLPTFNLKANYGTLNVTIQRVTLNEKSFSRDQIESLDNFQVYLKDSIYKTSNSVLMSDPQRPILIAPLNQEPITDRYVVDWQLIQCILNLDEEDHLLSIPSKEMRKSIEFSPANYENKVLIPWYKKDEKDYPELLCSLSVTDLTAKSPFDVDTSKPGTFEEYFVGKKHVVEIFHPEYPLILCKQLGKQLNFLTEKVNSYEMRKQMQSKFMLKMVPELTNIHILPGSLYVQGKFLPSILHRIYRLLVANELRKKVAQYFNWNVDECGEDSNEADEDNSESLEDAIQSMKLNTTANEVEKKKGVNEGKTEEKKKTRKICLLETENPNNIDWDMIQKPYSSPERMRKSVRDTKYALPEPPIFQSEVCCRLVDINTVKSYGFDISTDFTLERGPSMKTIMEAITLSNAQDNIDLEKLEVMGDSVLKLVVSLHISRAFPTWDEGEMTLLRMQLISNAHMYQLAKKLELGSLLSGCIFIPDKSWLPCGFTVLENVENFVVSKELDYSDLNSLPQSALQNNEMLESHLKEMRAVASERKKGEGDSKVPHTTYTHSHIGDKSVADSMEAIIGAYYVNGGIDGAFRIMEFLGMRGPLEKGDVTVYSRESTMDPVKPVYFDKIESKKGQKIVPLLSQLEGILCYTFKNPWLAVEALTHPTYMGNRITPCYERLEYLGDAILDFLVTNYILQETNITDPGKITDLRSALVNNITFASIVVRFGFQKFLKYDSEPLGQFITNFVGSQEEGEENEFRIIDPHGSFSDFECPVVQEIDVPKVLGDIFESLAGAVFIDSGMSIDTVWKVFYRLMKYELDEFSKNIPKSPLRDLYEQFPGKVKFRKSQESSTGNPNKKNTTLSPKFQTVFLKVVGQDGFVRGIGTNIKQAKQAAAKYLLRKLKSG